NSVIASVAVGDHPYGVAISPGGDKVYVSNNNDNTVSVISTATNTVIATITTPAYGSPTGVSVSPDGGTLYIENYVYNEISVVNTSTNQIIATVPISGAPSSQGNFISSGPCKGNPET